MLNRRSVLAGTTAALLLPTVAPSVAWADAKRQSLVDQSLRSASRVLSGKDYPDALKLMPKARGLIIVPELVQGGFIIGAAGGRGVLLSRGNPGNWSYPAFYGMGSGSVGLQIGGKVSEIVFIILTEKGLQAILDHKFKFGAEAGVTMVAVGAGFEGASTAALGTDIVALPAPTACSPAPRWKAPTSTPTTTGTRSITAPAPPARRSWSTAATPTPAPSRSGNSLPSGRRPEASSPGSSRRLDTSDADSIRVFGKNPGIQPHPPGWTLLDGLDALDERLQLVSDLSPRRTGYSARA